MSKKGEKIGFEDWYFRIIDEKGEYLISLDIRITKKGRKLEGILQVERTTGTERIISTCSLDKIIIQEIVICIDGSQLGVDKMILNIDEPGLKIRGEIGLSHKVDLKQSFLQPGLMGFYKWIPFLEFYQEVLSLQSVTVGRIEMNDETYSMDGGNCYIQKQWGEHFPNVWLWAQGNTFDKKRDLSIALGVARLKIFFNYYTAFAIPLHYDDHTEIFANYNGGHIAKLYRYKGYVHLIVTKKDKMLDVKIYGRDEPGCIANKETHGIRDIYECEMVKMEVKLTERGRVILEDSSLCCGIQMGGNTSKLK